MPVYSKIQYMRDAKRREQKRTWKQNQKKTDKIYSESSAAVRKRKQRENAAILHQRQLNKRIVDTKRKQRNRAKQKEKTELERIIKENVRRRKKEKQQRWREKASTPIASSVNKEISTTDVFPNKMNRSRAIRKLKSALPHTPVRRVATIKAYLSTNKSPTVQEIQRQKLVPSPEEIKESKMNESVVKDIKSVISGEKLKRNDKSREIVDIITASVSGPTVEKCRAKVALAKKLGLPIRRISKGSRIRTRVLHSEQTSYQYIKRKTRSDKLSEENRKLIYDFWCSPDNSRLTGNKNDVKRVRVGPKTYCSHAVQILEKTQSEVFLGFQQTYPEIKVSQRTFDKCKPYFVRAARLKDRTTCCCRYHLESKYIFNAFMSHRNQLVKNGAINERNFKSYETLAELCVETMCPIEVGEIHLKDCLERNCSKCGVNLLKISEPELSVSDDAPDLKWKKFEYIDIKTKNGTKKKITLVDKTTKPGVMIDNFKKVLQFFPGHNFRAKWQNDQLKKIIENLPEDECVTVHDFSENYRCTEQVEIQSNYFQRTEVSIHVSLIYRHSVLEIDGSSSSPEDPNIVCEHFYVISPDEKHDQYYVHHVQKLISEYLKSINYTVTTMHEFCDGCQSQYKSRNCLGNLAESVNEFGYSKIIRNYFESSHGKGPQDAAGGLLKNQADIAVIRGKVQIRSAADLFNFAEHKLKTPRSHTCKRRIFRYVEEIQRDSQNFRPIKGIRLIHRVETVDSNRVLLRNVSCYCDNCLNMDHSIENCLKLAQVGKSTEVKLVSNGQLENEVNEVNDDQNENIADLIAEGNIFAVLCDDDKHDFYLLKATSGVQTLQRKETDKWGASFPSNASVIRGLYFTKKENSILQYKLIKHPPAIVPSASVLYICQDSSINNNSLSLMESENSNILECVNLSELRQ